LRQLLLIVVITCIVGMPVWLLFRFVGKRRAFSTPDQSATFEVLVATNSASPLLRSGLSAASVNRTIPYLQQLLGCPSVAVVDHTGLLAWEGPGDHHASALTRLATTVLSTGQTRVIEADELDCGEADCPIKTALAVPISGGEEVLAVLVCAGPESGPGLVRLADEVSRWITTQVELAEFDSNRVRLAQAELRALRAQISPHFIYNALTAIASFTRTDPDRARDLILEFADFTRYTLRSSGAFTTVAEELKSIERYLTLEGARFGDRLQVRLQIEPEALPVVIPFLIIQPLVENAVRHGIEGRPGAGRLTIRAQEQGGFCVISVEDDGVGMDPEALRRQLADRSTDGEHVGMRNVDERLRSVYGEDHGLVIETAPDAGTKVIVRVPKYRPGVSVT
jgi:two-component system, LytTR family, sensor kinase